MKGKKTHQFESKEGLLYEICSVKFWDYDTVLWIHFHSLL